MLFNGWILHYYYFSPRAIFVNEEKKIHYFVRGFGYYLELINNINAQPCAQRQVHYKTLPSKNICVKASKTSKCCQFCLFLHPHSHEQSCSCVQVTTLPLRPSIKASKSQTFHNQPFHIIFISAPNRHCQLFLVQ